MIDYPDGLLLVLPVPFKQAVDGSLLIEEQASSGLDKWADLFPHVTVIAPSFRDNSVDKETTGTVIWREASRLRHRDSITLVALPMAYQLSSFAASFASSRRILLEHIDRNRYLQFAIGGLIGDWAAVGARLARARGRLYSIHTDRVEHEVLLRVTRDAPPMKRLKAIIAARVMKAYHRSIIRGCSLGLWHGNECYLAYSPWSRENHLIHDIHLKAEDAISPESLSAKLESASSQGPVRIAYAGRLDPMKAPLEWLRALARVRDLGVTFEAVWLGDGPLREEFQALLDELGLRSRIRTPGFVGRAELLDELIRTHLFVFTHVTPESPRCLLEALVAGAPIVGYDNPFARDLCSSGHGGGAFVPIGDYQALGDQIAGLAADRTRLQVLIQQAALNGKRFNVHAVFEERSQLIRRYS